MSPCGAPSRRKPARTWPVAPESRPPSSSQNDGASRSPALCVMTRCRSPTWRQKTARTGWSWSRTSPIGATGRPAWTASTSSSSSPTTRAPTRSRPTPPALSPANLVSRSPTSRRAIRSNRGRRLGSLGSSWSRTAARGRWCCRDARWGRAAARHRAGCQTLGRPTGTGGSAGASRGVGGRRA